MRPDPHRRTVYLMERREFSGIWRYSRLRVGQRRKLLARLCKLYEVPVIPLISRHVHGQAGAYCSERNRLEFDPVYGVDVLTFAHEVAHYFTHHKHGARVQDHGPSFLRNYARVISSLRIMPMAGMRAVYRKYRLPMA